MVSDVFWKARGRFGFGFDATKSNKERPGRNPVVSKGRRYPKPQYSPPRGEEVIGELE